MRLVAQEQLDAVAVAGEAQETIGEAEVAVLGFGDFEAVGEFLSQGEGGGTIGADVMRGGSRACPTYFAIMELCNLA